MTEESQGLCEFIDRHTVRFVRHLAHPDDRVWAAVSDGDEIGRWFIAPAHIELREGGRVRLGLNFRGTIERLEAGRTIEFSTPPNGWRFHIEPGSDPST